MHRQKSSELFEGAWIEQDLPALALAITCTDAAKYERYLQLCRDYFGALGNRKYDHELEFSRVQGFPKWRRISKPLKSNNLWARKLEGMPLKRFKSQPRHHSNYRRRFSLIQKGLSNVTGTQMGYHWSHKLFYWTPCKLLYSNKLCCPRDQRACATADGARFCE